MSKFQNYLKTFDITSTLTEEDIDKTLALLQIYGRSKDCLSHR